MSPERKAYTGEAEGERADFPEAGERTHQSIRITPGFMGGGVYVMELRRVTVLLLQVGDAERRERDGGRNEEHVGGKEGGNLPPRRGGGHYVGVVMKPLDELLKDEDLCCTCEHCGKPTEDEPAPRRFEQPDVRGAGREIASKGDGKREGTGGRGEENVHGPIGRLVSAFLKRLKKIHGDL